MKLALFALVICSVAASSQAISFDKREIDIGAAIGIYLGRPSKGGPLRDLFDAVVVPIVKGVVAAVNPIVDGLVSKGLGPVVKGLVDSLGINACEPNSPVELLVWDILMLIDKQIGPILGLVPIDYCKKPKARPPSAIDRHRITGKPWDSSWFCVRTGGGGVASALEAAANAIVPINSVEEGGEQLTTGLETSTTLETTTTLHEPTLEVQEPEKSAVDGSEVKDKPIEE